MGERPKITGAIILFQPGEREPGDWIIQVYNMWFGTNPNPNANSDTNSDTNSDAYSNTDSNTDSYAQPNPECTEQSGRERGFK